MAVYLLVPIAQNADRLDAAVLAHVKEADRYQIANRAGWFVRFGGTSVELGSHLTITGQKPGEPSPVGAVIISLVTSYYGRGNSDMWEWLKLRMEAG